jgi:hypothetical protein
MVITANITAYLLSYFAFHLTTVQYSLHSLPLLSLNGALQSHHDSLPQSINDRLCLTRTGSTSPPSTWNSLYHYRLLPLPPGGPPPLPPHSATSLITWWHQPHCGLVLLSLYVVHRLSVVYLYSILIVCCSLPHCSLPPLSQNGAPSLTQFH